MNRMYTAAVLSIFLCLAPFSAHTQAVFPGVVLISNERIVYSGLYGDEGSGIFSINMNSGEHVKLCDTKAYLLAASEDYILFNDMTALNGNGIIIESNGEVVYKDEYEFDATIYSEGSFFSGKSEIEINAGEVTFHDVLGENCVPIEVVDGYLYYLDKDKYASVSGMYGVESASSLNRLNLSSGDSQKLTGEGVKLISATPDELIYEMDDFYTFDGEDTKLISVGRGVYKSDANGQNAVRLCETADSQQGVIETYDVFSDGIVYGTSYNYESTAPVPEMVLKSISATGEVFPDIAIDFGKLVGVCDGIAYVCASRYDVDYMYVDDDIVAVNTATGEKKSLITGESLVLRYFDDEPQIAFQNGIIYFIAMKEDDHDICLWSVNIDGSGFNMLARLYSTL